MAESIAKVTFLPECLSVKSILTPSSGLNYIIIIKSNCLLIL